MIRLTKLNCSSIALNAELVKCVENAPDTVITLTTGDKVMVRETMDEVIDRIVAYRRSVNGGKAIQDEVSMGQIHEAKLHG